MSFKKYLISASSMIIPVIISQILLGCGGQSTQEEKIKDKTAPSAEQTTTLVSPEKIKLDQKIAEDLKLTSEFEQYNSETKELSSTFATLDVSESTGVEIVKGHNAYVREIFAALPSGIQSLKREAGTVSGLTESDIGLPEAYYKLVL